MFRERESPNETAMKLPASTPAPCCPSPLAPLHVRPSHMRRETSLFAAWAWRLHAPQARGRAAALRARTEARVPLRPRCAGAVLRACEGAPEGACSLFILSDISTRRRPSPVRPARARRRWFSGPLAFLDGWWAHKSAQISPPRHVRVPREAPSGPRVRLVLRRTEAERIRCRRPLAPPARHASCLSFWPGTVRPCDV